MEKSRKNLRDYSILILFLVALSAARIIINIFSGGLNVDAIGPLPEGLSVEMAKILVIVAMAFSFVALLPSLFVGYKGIKVAAEPDTSKAHIILAKVMFVFFVITVISSFTNLIKPGSSVPEIFALVDSLLDAIAFFMFIKYAGEVRRSQLG